LSHHASHFAECFRCRHHRACRCRCSCIPLVNSREKQIRTASSTTTKTWRSHSIETRTVPSIPVRIYLCLCFCSIFLSCCRIHHVVFALFRELHDDVWKEILDRMHQSNIRNFTIYYHEETSTLFQCFEWVGHWRYYNENNRTLPSKEQEKVIFDQDMKAIAEDTVTRKWWKECEPCQDPFSQWKSGSNVLSEGGSGNWWAPLECVNHCGHWPTAYSEQQRDPDFVRLDATMAADT
jgi:L-rhamnose mutarotase